MAEQIKKTPLASHTELEGSPGIEFTENGVRGTRVLKCAWEDRFKLAKQLFGYIEVDGDGDASGGVIRRPHQFPGFEAATCRGVRIEPFDSKISQDATKPGEGVASYTYAKLTVSYESRGWDGGASDDEGGPMFTERLEGSVQFIKVPNRKLYWSNTADATTGSRDPLDVDSTPGLMVRTFDYKVKLSNLSRLPSAVWSLAGGVNSSAVSSTRFAKTFAIGTLLYAPPQVEVTTDPDGRTLYTMDVAFTYNPAGWNKFYKPGNTEPQPVYDEGGVEMKFYPEVDFTPIFNLF